MLFRQDLFLRYPVKGHVGHGCAIAQSKLLDRAKHK
jgi:hypothetical protein